MIVFIILLAIYLFSIIVCVTILEIGNYTDCEKWAVSFIPIANTIYFIYLIYSLVTKKDIKEFIENLKI